MVIPIHAIISAKGRTGPLTSKRRFPMSVNYYTTGIIYIHNNVCYSYAKRKKRPGLARKGNDMTAMIRLYSADNERLDTQLWAKELRDVFVCPMPGKLERRDCVMESGYR